MTLPMRHHLAGLRRFVGDRRGMAAVEFAMILPLMLMLGLGAYEVGEGMTVARKVSHVTNALSDLVGQSRNITNADMTNILNAASSIMTPYSSTPLKIVVTGVTIDSAGKATVAWSDAKNATALTKGATVSTLPTNLKQASTFLVMAQVTYPYTPSLGYVVTGGVINFGDTFYIRPRQSASITRSAS